MTTNHKIEDKVTDWQVETECPARLQEIGRTITAQLAKADKATERADNHLITVNQLIAEARALCDSDGFDAFRETFCPTLGRSRAYAVLAITAGKRTIDQDRAESRKRQANKRASDKEIADGGKYTRKEVPDILAKGNVEN